MNFLDYILIVIFLLGFILGYKDGFIRKVLGLLGLITAIFLAITYSVELGEYLSPMFNNENYLAKIVSGFVIFFTVILVFAILKRLIHPSDKVNKFVNQLLGGITGVIQIIFITSVFLLLLNILNVPQQKDIDQSMLYTPVYSVIPTTIDLIVGSDFKTEGFLKDYIDSGNIQEYPDEFTNPVNIDSLLNND